MNEGEASPDPVGQPRAYQDFLLALLGDDDPAAVQSSTAASLREVAAEAGPDLFKEPEPGEWSAAQVIAHLCDAEIAMSGRYRFILTQDAPVLLGYDQEVWIERLHDGDEPVADLLDAFEALRKANVTLWVRSSAEDRARVGMHAERGAESFDLSFRMIAGHDRLHLGQIRRALEAVRRS